MKNLLKRAYFAIYILLTCVFVGCIGIGSRQHANNTIDSLHVELDKANKLCEYHQAMQDSSGGILRNSDMWWAHRDSSNRCIDKMISIIDEMIYVKNAR